MQTVELGMDPAVKQEIERWQRDSTPKIELSAYAGEWIALRAGREIVDHDSNPRLLRSRTSALLDVVLMHVPVAEEEYVV